MRFIFAFLSVILCATTVCAGDIRIADSLKPTDLRVIGQENAPATLYIFTSLSCPHCSAYHADVMPALQDEIVQPGLAKLILVDMPYDARTMMGTMLSRCVVPTQYDAFVTVVFENQAMWQNSSTPRPVLTGYAKLVGMTDEQINRCLSDKSLQKEIMKQRDNLANLYGVRGMPSTVIVKNGKYKLLTGTDKEALIAAIKKELN